jgi:hypothetical protein
MHSINVKRFSKSKHPTPELEQPEEPEQPEQPIFYEVKEPEEEPEEEPIKTREPKIQQTQQDNDDSFLADLHKDNFIDSITQEKHTALNKKELLKMEKEQEKERQRIQKQLDKEQLKILKQPKTSKVSNDSDSIYGDCPTEILGKDKHLLLKKVNQFKKLFPEELKTFKIKKGANVEELNAYVDEMEVLVEVNSIDEFLMDALINSIKVIEGVSTLTKNYNISGLADILKTNKQFIKLTKIIFLKYGMFANTPPEQQLIFIVATSAYICINKNKNKGSINSFLNEPIQVSV